jgi:hypothetical protein
MGRLFNIPHTPCALYPAGHVGVPSLLIKVKTILIRPRKVWQGKDEKISRKDGSKDGNKEVSKEGRMEERKEGWMGGWMEVVREGRKEEWIEGWMD